MVNTPPVSPKHRKNEDDIPDLITQISKLDFGDPLYLHASDISSVPLISFKLKCTENYKVWACSMELPLETKNKMCFIDGSCEKDVTDLALSKQWDRCNYVVLSWVLGSVTELPLKFL